MARINLQERNVNIVSDYLEGKNMKDLAYKYVLSREAIRDILKKANVYEQRSTR